MTPCHENALDSSKLKGVQEGKLKEQSEKVRLLKKSNASREMIEAQVNELENLRATLKEMNLDTKQHVDYVKCRRELEGLAKRRSIFFPSFEIYGSVSGLFDLGPPGCLMKQAILTLWRQMFIFDDDLLELNATCLTPYSALKASGHVDRFCDSMVCDEKTGECYRADKLVEDYVTKRLQDTQPLTQDQRRHYETIKSLCSGFTEKELQDIIIQESIKAPLTGNALGPCFPFNLMFKTHYGAKKCEDNRNVMFLRPETAQGIFVNFRRLLEYNGGKLPFGVAQQGLGFRNEISPRNGLLRVREFDMVEIEYFVDPLQKQHPKFFRVHHLKPPLFSKTAQVTDGRHETSITLQDAVNTQMIQNECLAYYIGKVYLFILKCGINPQGIRFRQHLDSEKAHYACDCWDLDIETSYGWIECVGIADRSAYDLTQHAKATKVPQFATRRYDQPKKITRTEAVLNKPLLGKAFKGENRAILQCFENFSQHDLEQLSESLKTHHSCDVELPSKCRITLTPEMVSFRTVEKQVVEEQFIPNVIEPSFGIGRLLYCILEHVLQHRSTDPARHYLALPLVLSPIKCSILPISSNNEFNDLITLIETRLKSKGISCKVDSSGASIGKRYARTDEIGIFFAVTIDFQSLKDQTVTLRHRDTMQQLRLPVDSLAPCIRSFLDEEYTWHEACQMFPSFTTQDIS